MDRLGQIRSEAGESQDATLDTSSPPSEAFMSANESSSKYFTLSEVDSTFSISPSKDSTTSSIIDSERTITGETDIISALSPIPKTDVETYKIGKHIEAANILSGGVNIFEDNENSYDGDELVIDDNAALEEEKTNVTDVKLSDSAGVPLVKTEESIVESMDEVDGIPSKDTEVVLQIDGKNVDAIDIGNGLYLYRKAGQEELAAVQIIDDDQQQPSFKFLKVRENIEGNLEVYEEIEVEIPKEVPTKDGNTMEKACHVPIKDINIVITESSNKVIDKVNKTPKSESISTVALASELNIDLQSDSKSEVNLNGKMMKFNESRKSPLIGTFTPMTYHSTPNKDGIPLTKTMVDQQLHPSRHSDNIKKTIEVHTESCRSKPKDLFEALGASFSTPEFEPCKTETEEHCHQTPVLHIQSQMETETVVKIASEETKGIAQGQEDKNDEEIAMNSIETISIPEKQKNGTQISEEIKINAENKVLCTDETKDFQICKERANATEEKAICENSTVVENSTLNEDSTQHHKNQEDNQVKIGESSLNKNIDMMNDSSKTKSISTINETEKSINIDNTNITVEDLRITDITITTHTEHEDLTNEPIKDNEDIKGPNLPLYKKDKTAQCLDQVINQETCAKQLELSSTCKVETKSEKSEESKSISIGKNVMTELVLEPNTNDISNEKECNSEICSSIKDKLQNCETMSIINKISDKPYENVNESKKEITQISALQITHDNRGLQNEHVFCNKDQSVKVSDGMEQIIKNEVNTKGPSTEKESPISLVPIQKNVLELETSSKDDTDSSKILNPKDIKITLSNNKPIETRKEVPITKLTATKSSSAVPFGKWTEANRQEFLNKIKETKVTSNTSSTNQIKQTNDLNRRDILKKFDSQRHSAMPVPAKNPDFGSVPKFSTKMETAAFTNKSAVIHQSNPPNSKVPTLKTQTAVVKHKPTITKKAVKEEPLNTEMLVQRRVINSQELIDKTIEGIITRAIKIKNIPDLMKEQMTIHTVENPKDAKPLPGSLDDIEMKMNELHGISFIERPVQELPQVYAQDSKAYNKLGNQAINKNTKIPKLLPFKKTNLPKSVKDSQDDTSDEEIIEHEPITGDIDVSKQNLISLLSSKEKSLSEMKKDAIITEKDFDKFARRNSVTYENCLTVNFDSKDQHNVIQTVVEKDPYVKKLSRNELLLAESKAKSSSKQNLTARQNNQTIKPQMLKSSEEESYNKNYQSKVQIAYQSALTAKRSLECPITIIEDKPVKVVFMDTNTEFTPAQLNVQGQELSPCKIQKTDTDLFVHSASESMDSDIIDSNQGIKSQDETKSKSKHQRKQVLTPVEEEPEIQLIEPSEVAIKISPTKKRRNEEKVEKSTKNLVPKKSYLLNRNVVDEHTSKSDQPRNIFTENENRKETFMAHTNTIDMIDNLVKAAELIETQSENNNSNITQTSEIPQNTPVKRGRGRPRKYPLPEPESNTNKPLSPEKKPRLIDAKARSYTDSDESSDGEIVKENWTMGKINENIVCPICNKLFRSENVVFKHVKHCTGPSPNRSDSDKRSPRRMRNSQESDRKICDSRSDDTDSDDDEKLNSPKSDYIFDSTHENDDVIVIEDTPIKEKNYQESTKMLRKTKHQYHTNNLICEFCGKTFRQLSYLVSHKLQHKNENVKKTESEHITNKTVFSCEVCKKEFRKLHHLVQHRIIHNPSSRLHRKSSVEQNDSKNSKSHNDDASAGFRCEPCDKSFRKLHHLVEHRETHDGINKKGTTSSANNTNEISKSIQVHQCDTCQKVFKKLQDLLEHKEQHYDTSSEKSDDKSVKSSLSTKDIIHECSLCYMVFPNEQSLNKHTVICLRKKKQSAAKQAAKKAEEQETNDVDNLKTDENMPQDIETYKDEPQIEVSNDTQQLQETTVDTVKIDLDQDKDNVDDHVIKEEFEERKFNCEPKPSNLDIMPKKRHSNGTDKIKTIDDIETPAKIKKIEDKERIVIPDTPTPKKKSPHKEKIAPTITKRHKTVNVPLPVIDDSKPTVESSDDDEIRYMLNPNFKEEENTERKIFMKIRDLKRSSLQIERPNSKDLIKRRISLQHPPKMPRLKAKAIEPKPLRAVSVEKNLKAIMEAVNATESDDGDVKYSFPEKARVETVSKVVEKKAKRQSTAAKRKSLSGIAKRKSLGKIATDKPKKRTAEVEHRCDCGQLFSSAALLARHTTLAHTPPRIRRRRSPPPDTHTQPEKSTNTKPTNTKPTNTKPTNTKPTNTKPANTKPLNTKPTNTKPSNTKSPNTKLHTKPAVPKHQTKPSTPKTTIKPKTNTKPKGDVTNSNKSNVVGVATRKSSISNSDTKTVEFNFKSLRSAYRGIPAEKMRKLAEKTKK